MSFEKEIIEAEFRTVSSSKTLKEIESLSNAILKLKRDTEALERQKKEAAVQFGANSKEVKELTAQIKANNAQIGLNKSKLEEANSKLKVTEMSTRQLRQRQAELKKAMESVNKEAFPDRWNTLNKAYKDTTAQLDKVTNGSNSVKKGIGSVMSYAKGLLPAFGFSAIAGGVLKLSKELFELSMTMKSDNIRNTTIFGDSLKYVESQAAQLSKAMGVTNREFVANAASSADLLKPLGFTSEEAARLSVKMQQLAGPLAEWSKGKYNAAQITEVMNGALTGEMERLKGLGIIIQQSSPEYTNLVKLKQKEQNCSVEQAKALAALELMYQKSTDAQLAFQAGGNGLLRDWENLKATWRRAKEWMVELFDDTSADQLERQQNLVNGLAVQLTNTNTSSAERVKLLNQLKSINPEIVEGLNAENLSMGKLRENLDKYNGSMLERITLEKMNKDVDKKGNKFGEANADLGSKGLELSKLMAKLNPGVAQKNMSLEEKMAEMKEWRSSEVSAFDFKKKNDYLLLDKYYQEYQDQLNEVEQLKAEYDESIKDLDTQKGMMVFPSSDAQTSPILKLDKKGSDSGKTGKTTPPQPLLAVQQEKLQVAQKARDEATDIPTLTARNKEIEAINTEISRLQTMGKMNNKQNISKIPQSIDISNFTKIDDNIDLSDFEEHAQQTIDAWEIFQSVKEKFNLQTPENELQKAQIQLQEFHDQQLLSDSEYQTAKELLDKEASLKQNTIEAEEKLQKAKTDEEEWQAEIELAKSQYEEKMLMAGENRRLQMDAEKEHQNALNKIKDKQFKADVERINKDKALQLEKIGYMSEVAGIIGNLAQEGTALSKAMFLVQKGLAIAEIIVNLQKELALHAVNAAVMGPILGPPYLAAMSTKAMVRSGISVAAVAAQAITGFRSGGFTSTAPSDDREAGVVHANEFVATADAVRNPRVLPVLQMIDQAQRNGTIRTLDLSNAARQGFRLGGFTSENPAGNIVTLQSSPNSLEPELRQLLTAILTTTKELRDKPLEFPWYGRGGLDEKMKKARKYEQNLNY